MNYLTQIVKYLLSLLRLFLEFLVPTPPPLNDQKNVMISPESVNFHFTRQCNYQCKLLPFQTQTQTDPCRSGGFCFHTAKTSFLLPLAESKRGLEMLARAGMKKVNFSGGEPFLIQGGKYLGEMVRYCKEELDLESVTVVSNGSKVTESWMAEYGYYLDIMAVSVDSFNQEVNQKIGRRSGSRSSHLLSLQAVRSWCREYSVLFKVNTALSSTATTTTRT